MLFGEMNPICAVLSKEISFETFIPIIFSNVYYSETHFIIILDFILLLTKYKYITVTAVINFRVFFFGFSCTKKYQRYIIYIYI